MLIQKRSGQLVENKGSGSKKRSKRSPNEPQTKPKRTRASDARSGGRGLDGMTHESNLKLGVGADRPKRNLRRRNNMQDFFARLLSNPENGKLDRRQMMQGLALSATAALTARAVLEPGAGGTVC